MTTRRPQLKVTLVGDDLSAGAGSALRRSAVLPEVRGRVLHVLRVLPGGHRSARGEEAVEEARVALRERAEQIVGQARLDELPRGALRATVVEGEPFVELIRHARAVDADLVLVGAHARRTWRDGVVGTTVERIIRKGDTPVLVVKRPPRNAYRRAVAAIEASDAARRVLDLAVALLPSSGAKLTALSCFTVPFETEISGGVREVAARTRREYLQERSAACQRLLSRIEALRTVTLELAVVHGDPRVEVLRRIERERADLLVLGTHARSGLAHALLGSTAEWLIRAAPCDVAVTRPARFAFELP
ncbi:universal stress protein [Anaeromyxobacter sp. Fw109-5]|uniref:universal stress protein n=1 Tax=Anaeromyxobacter sp. (strain Fw109-5) TaxID=404589 RepID=UPI0000ED6D39|nr:universal stress protein [Anaeromyxobacter sp. Fw109-5]ABS28009.1 universal stress family protein [Anaeromyxobacter sp. Fw109-5]